MNSGDRNVEEQGNDVPERAEGGHGDDEEEDDDFGEFEGFEGGVEHLQAQPAPSPWATFPDLLVQTSPATPAEESQSSSRIGGAVAREVWHPVAAVPWGASAAASDESRHGIPPGRRLNPPDVSLGTHQGATGRVTPDNVHDAAHAEVLNHMPSVSMDARLPVAQLDLLQQQLDDAEQSRVLLEEQVDQLRQRNVELEQQVASSQAQINDLQNRLQQNQETVEQRLSQMREMNYTELRQNLQSIQEEIVSLRNSQTAERNELEASRHQIEGLRTDVCKRFDDIESNIRKEYAELEQRVISRFGEECLEIRRAVDSIAQQCTQQFSGTLSQIVLDTLQKTSESGQESNLMQQIKVELERHEENQNRIMQEERRRQLATISSALQSAVQHLLGAINNTPKKEGGDTS